MIVTIILLAVAVVGMMLSLIIIVGVALYDVKEIKKARLFKQHPYSRQYLKRPLISVVIAASGDEDTLTRCLDSLLKGRYRKFEVIIIDRSLKNRIRQIANTYSSKYKQNIRLFKTKRSAAKASAAAYRKYGQGELVTVFDDTNTFGTDTLRRAAWHFNASPKLDALILNSQVTSAFSTIGLFEKYEGILALLSKKASSSLGVIYDTTHQNIVYSKNVFGKAKTPGKARHFFYADDAILQVQPSKSLFRLLRRRYYLQISRLHTLIHIRGVFFTRDAAYTKFFAWFYLPFVFFVGLAALCLPLLISYFIYVAVWINQPILFILCLVVLSMFFLFALWWNDHLSLRQKLTYSALLPITYGMFYVLSFTQIFAVVRGLTYRKSPID
jgi:glycosyltransferase involved in cell wall biosynthesis